MAQNPDFPNVGGAWQNDNGSIAFKLDNGLTGTLWPNKYKEAGTKQPDFKVSTKLETAQTFGLLVEREGGKGSAPVTVENVDMNDLPF